MFLNLELAVVEKRVADLLALLSDGTILHVDFQSSNHRDMAYREGIYGLMAGRKYRRRIRQVVLYLGSAKMRMTDRLDLGGIQVSYRLLDIREVDSRTLLESGNPGDWALAMLARGGVGRLREIVQRANRLPGPETAKAADADGDSGWLARGIGTIDNGVQDHGHQSGDRQERIPSRHSGCGEG